MGNTHSLSFEEQVGKLMALDIINQAADTCPAHDFATRDGVSVQEYLHGEQFADTAARMVLYIRDSVDGGIPQSVQDTCTLAAAIEALRRLISVRVSSVVN